MGGSSLGCSALLILIMLLVPGWTPAPRESYGGQHHLAVIPPPTRIEWREHEVGGYMLGDPAVRDSLGRLKAITLPPGSILQVPIFVVGPKDISEDL